MGITQHPLHLDADCPVKGPIEPYFDAFRQYLAQHGYTLRHTCAMHMLQSGVPFNVIALWLGHEKLTTTHRYVEADLAMKEQALARLEEPNTKMSRYKAPDSLMQFLQTL